jgi:hypothetical protein
MLALKAKPSAAFTRIVSVKKYMLPSLYHLLLNMRYKKYCNHSFII